MKIAVTGGAGRIGSAVSERLLGKGHQVLVLDKKAPRFTGAKHVYLDLRDRQILQPVLEGCDAVIHLGELPNAGAGESPLDVFTRNTATGSMVMQTCADLRIPRLIYSSTCQVYGLWGNRREPNRSLRFEKVPMDETQSLQPQNEYGLSKVANEGFAKLLADRGDLSVAVFRLPWTAQGRHLQYWIEWYRNSPNVKPDDHYDGFWTFVHVEDVATAFELALEKPRPGFEAYHLFANDIAGTQPLRERLPVVGFDQMLQLPADWPDLAAPVTCAKALDHFGWKPQHSWASIIASQPT